MHSNTRPVHQHDALPFIDPTPPPGAADKVKELLAPFDAAFGRAPDALRMLAVSPSVLENYIHNIGYFIHHPRLSPALTGMIRYLASAAGGCTYCVNLNEQILLGNGVSLEAIRAAKSEPQEAPLPAKEKALLALVYKAVTTPHAVTADDVERARAHQWSDGDIFDALYHGHSARAFGNLLDSLNLQQEGVLG